MAIEKELREGITLITQGREEGFNILYSHTYNYVYGRAKFIMKNEEDALDLTQETFIQAYKGISSLENADNVYAWLGGIVYRQGMKLFRKKRELLINEDAESIFEDIISEDNAFRPEEAAQAKATSEIVMNMVNELPELQRAAVLAFYYDNMKIDDIAKIFECSSNTIKSRLNYAKKFLKEKVTEHEKQNRYKLCSLSPAILLLAFKSLFSTDGYALSKAAAQAVYNTACGVVGLVPSAITAGGTVGATTIAATTSGVGVGATATTGMATSSGMVTIVGTATKAGLTLGAKIGIAFATVAVTGSVVAGAYVYNESIKDTPAVQTEIETASTSFAETEGFVLEEVISTPETVSPTETSTSSAEDSDTSETIAEPTQEPKPGDYWREYLTGEHYDPDGSYKVIISNVQAPTDKEEDVSFEVYMEIYDAYTGVTQTLNAMDVKINDRISTFEAVSSTGNTWYPTLQFMEDGSINFGADILTPDRGMASIMTSYSPIILIKQNRELPLLQDVRISDGTYVCDTESSRYELAITNTQDRDDYQVFDMNMLIYTFAGTRVFQDNIIGDTVQYQNGIATFLNGEDSHGSFYGYLTLLEDGSIAFSYDVKDENSTWVTPCSREPLILQKQ